eukprot:SAG22_NODE_864_length_6788_cov_2.700553_2_plen_249_part_00
MIQTKARTVFYYTVDDVRVESDLGRYFLAHPELTLTRYDVDRRTGQLGAFARYQYDFSNPAVVAAWAAGIAAAVKAGGHAGVFIDGYQGWHECRPPAPTGGGGDGDGASSGGGGGGGGGGVGGVVGGGHLSGCPSEASAGLRTTVGNRTVNATALLQGWWWEVSRKALPLPCVSTVFLSKTAPFLAVCLVVGDRPGPGPGPAAGRADDPELRGRLRCVAACISMTLYTCRTDAAAARAEAGCGSWELR